MDRSLEDAGRPLMHEQQVEEARMGLWCATCARREAKIFQVWGVLSNRISLPCR